MGLKIAHRLRVNVEHFLSMYLYVRLSACLFVCQFYIILVCPSFCLCVFICLMVCICSVERPHKSGQHSGSNICSCGKMPHNNNLYLETTHNTHKNNILAIHAQFGVHAGKQGKFEALVIYRLLGRIAGTFFIS